PFTEPASSPWTKYLWKAKNRTRGGIIDRKDDAAITSTLLPKKRVCSRIATVTGLLPGPEKTRATSRSFQTQRNWNTAKEAIAGSAKGSTMVLKMRHSPAPSTCADSSNSD